MTNSSKRQARVLYLINGFKRGGAEKGLLHLVQNGAFEGCDLKVLSIIEDQGAHVDELRAAGVSVEHLSPGRRMTVWHWARAIRRFRRALKRIQPDLLVLSLPQANIAGRLAAMALPNITVASFEHNTHLAHSVYESLFRLTSRRVDWLLADCEITAKVACERLYMRAPKQQIVLPLASFTPKKVQHPIIADPFRIISAARFTETKNQQAIIEAIRLLKDRGYSATLTLYGEGPKADEYSKLIRSLGLAGSVSMPGFNPRWMEDPANLFVVASRNEGLCIVALEALSRGIPVMSTRVGGLVDYGVAAQVRFLDSGTASEMATAITWLIDHPDDLREMRTAGLQLIDNRYSNASTKKIYRDFASRVRSLVH